MSVCIYKYLHKRQPTFVNVKQISFKWWSHDGQLIAFYIVAEAHVQIAAGVGAVVRALGAQSADQRRESVSNDE